MNEPVNRALLNLIVSENNYCFLTTIERYQSHEYILESEKIHSQVTVAIT